MVLGLITAAGVGLVAGYVLNTFRSYYAGSQYHEQQRADRVEELRRRRNELKGERSKSGCYYLFTLCMFFVFLLTVGGVLYVTEFFRHKKGLGKLTLDWRYWFNKDYELFNYNYYGIGGVALFFFVVIFPLLCFLYKACSKVNRLERELKDVQDELQQIERDSHGAGSAHAEGGYIKISNYFNCLNVSCTMSCYVTLVTSSTVLAFLSVIVFVCYVLYFYTFK